MKISRRAFTLLEMMIALVILSLIGAFSAVQVKKLIDAHRFESEISNLFIALQQAQVLSATYQTDIAWDIYPKDGVLCYRFTTDEPFKPHQFENKEIFIPHIVKLTFKDAKTTRLHFDIYSGGRIEPRGLLAFHQTLEEESKALWFDLQYGHLLKYAYRKPVIVKQLLPVKPN